MNNAKLQTLKYFSIYKNIVDLIEKEEYKKFEFIPTDEEFCKIYSVIRPTAAKALNLLAEDGLVERIKGKGTFVIRSKKKQSINGEQCFVGTVVPTLSAINHTGVLVNSVKL